VQSRKPVVALRRPPPPAAIESFIKSGESSVATSGPPPEEVEAPLGALAHHQHATAVLADRQDATEFFAVHPIRHPVAPEATPAPVRPGIVRRASGRVRRRTTVYLEPALAKWLVMFSAEGEMEISDVVGQALTAYRQAQQRASS
jgi:hypothetical protein